MITVTDIAKETGFSKSTVKAVLGKRADKLGIKAETTMLIQKTARVLGYSKNDLARQMGTGKTNVIAYFSYDLRREYIGRLIYGITMEAGNHDYFAKLFNYTEDKFEESVDAMLEQRPAGIISRIHTRPDFYNYLSGKAHRLSIPLVFIADAGQSKSDIFVHTNDFDGSAAAVEYLYRFGHRRIGYLGYTGLLQPRYMGYEHGLKKCGLALNPDFIFSEIKKYDRYFTMSPEQRPTAFFGATDEWVIEFFRQAYHLGIRVPEEVSLIGFGDTSAARQCIVPLTAVHQPFERFGREMVNLLYDEINSPDKRSFHEAAEKIIEVELIERESVAPPAV